MLAQDHQEEGGVGQEEALGGVGGVDVDHHDGGGEDGQEELGQEDEGVPEVGQGDRRASQVQVLKDNAKDEGE